jgi:hypothetical protein
MHRELQREALTATQHYSMDMDLAQVRVSVRVRAKG